MKKLSIRCKRERTCLEERNGCQFRSESGQNWQISAKLGVNVEIEGKEEKVKIWFPGLVRVMLLTLRRVEANPAQQTSLSD
jgi:hypothetical protein